MSNKTPHGNSNDSQSPRHLYAFYDHILRTLYKFGISKEPISQDGNCKRMRTQQRIFNSAAGSLRYTVRIIIRLIPGKLAAEEKEDDFIEKYKDKHGKEPRGNRDHKYPSRKR